MIDDVSASAPEALADVSTGSPDAVDSLTAFFMAQEESGQVDNPDTATASDEPVAAPEPATDDTKPDEPEADAEKPAEDAKEEAEAEPAEATTEDEAGDAADFDALTRKEGDEYLDTAEAIKAKYPRNTSKDVIEEMARYGAEAKRGHEVIEAIGGPEFIPGMTAIAKALQTGSPRDLFSGIIQTASAEELVKVLVDANHIALVQAEAMADNPETAEFGKALTAMIDGTLQERFGPNMSVAKMSKLALYDKAGWFDKIEEWAVAGYISHDDLESLIEVTNDPKLLEAQEKIKELEGQLGEKDMKATPQKPALALNEVDTAFGKLAADGIGKTLTEVVWKSSPLRDITTDTVETKEEKAFLRDRLLEDALGSFNASEQTRKLRTGYTTGKEDSAVFKRELTDAINKAVLGTREKTAVAERLLAKVYGNSRNGQLAKRNGNNQPRAEDVNTARATPTPTRDFGSEKLTRDQINKNLEESIAALG